MSPTTAERPSPASGDPTGQSLGPAAARQASYDQFEYSDLPGSERTDGAIGWYDIEADRDYLVGVTMADAGDVVIQGSDVEGNYARITAAARGIAERGALMVAVGGDHSISYPLGLGMEPLGELDVVHVDAHTDFIDVLDGSRLTGAQPAAAARRARLRPYRQRARGPQRGPRGGRWHERARRQVGDEPRRNRYRPAKVVRDGPRGRTPLRLDRPRRARRIRGARSLAPGARRAELPPASSDPRRGARRGRVIGFDVVELNPSRDPSGTTARVATWIVTHFLSEIFDQR